MQPHLIHLCILHAWPKLAPDKWLVLHSDSVRHLVKRKEGTVGKEAGYIMVPAFPLEPLCASVSSPVKWEGTARELPEDGPRECVLSAVASQLLSLLGTQWDPHIYIHYSIYFS